MSKDESPIPLVVSLMSFVRRSACEAHPLSVVRCRRSEALRCRLSQVVCPAKSHSSMLVECLMSKDESPIPLAVCLKSFVRQSPPKKLPTHQVFISLTSGEKRRSESVRLKLFCYYHPKGFEDKFYIIPKGCLFYIFEI